MIALRLQIQSLQWNAFADTAFIHLFPDGQYAAGTGRAELENNCTSVMAGAVVGNGDVLGAANPQLFCAPYYHHSYAHRE